jgi:hypothetical protein
MHVPVAKGAKASDLCHTVAGLCHSWRLEAVTEDTLRFFYGSVISLTSDLGTESGAADFPNVQHVDLFGQNLLPDIVDDTCMQQDSETTSCDHLFPNAFMIPGICHILANAAKQMHCHLKAWQDYMPQLSAVASFFHSSDNRKRLQYTCFAGEHESMSSFFDTSCPILRDWRWLITILVIRHVLSLEYSIFEGWSLQRFLAGAAEHPDRVGSEDSVNLRAVDAALTSPKFGTHL